MTTTPLSFKWMRSFTGSCFKFIILWAVAVHCISNTSIAQVSIANPINRAVYQRTGSGNGSANLIVSGSYTAAIASSVQARMVTPNTNTAVAGLDWRIIDSGPSKGVFYGTFSNVPAGWYTLQVRVMKSGTVLQSSQIDRVGVGDVFLIAGQSNARGFGTNIGAVGASTEKVVTHDFQLFCPDTFASYPSFTTLGSTTKPGMTGNGAWAYGKLGDEIVSQTGFPVAFFNAGADASSTLNYTQSMNGQGTTNPFVGGQFCDVNSYPNPVGQPYKTLNKTISYYNSLFGIKAVLWHQGESDNFMNTSTSDYQNRLNSLINFVRTDFNPAYTLPWVVSRASYLTINGTSSSSAAVIAGQNNVINPANKVFAGPITDGILGAGKRDDGTHFNNSGLIDLAIQWKNSLNPTFFSSAIAIPANTQPQLSISINNGIVTLIAPSASAYKWIAGDNYSETTLSTGVSFSATSGTYRCYLTDANGNITISQAVDVNSVLSQVDNNITCSTIAYLSDLKSFSQSNGYGPIEFDKSNGEDGDGDGSTITLNGQQYLKGLGVHAGSEVIYRLPANKFYNFISEIGVDDEVGSSGLVKFQVFGDNTLLFESSDMTGDSPTQSVNVNVAGFNTLKLVVLALGSFVNDHADWANARLTCTPPDLIPPTDPSNLVVSNQLTKCLGLTWTPATDNVGVTNYKIFLNNNLLATIPSTQLSYDFTNLTRNTAYTVGVQAVDSYSNLSNIVSLNVNTLNLIADYPGSSNPLFGDFCINTVELPQTTPTGGLFEYISGLGSYSLNANTGGFSSPVVNGFFGVSYTIDKNGTCEDVLNVNIRTNSKPAPTTITGGPTLINEGMLASFASAGCPSGHTWSDGSNLSSLDFSPSDTTLVYVFCRINGCLSDTSNTILVKVIPDCPDSFDLNSTVDDLNGTPQSLFFKAENSVEAKNKLTGTSNTIFTAGESIILRPGFRADSGTVFSAKIEGCP